MGTQLWPVSCRQEGMHPLVALPSTRHAHSATTLLVHVVWSTHRRAPWLDISFDPRLAELLARLAKRVGTETHAIGAAVPHATGHLWQAGYWAESVGPFELPAVVAYVRDQRAHHDGHREASEPWESQVP